MIHHTIVELGSVNRDGSLRYPGKWRQTWILFCPGVWILARFEPVQEFGT